MDQPRILRFGVFEVDVRAGELRKRGSKIKLQQQPFQILLALLERAGEVVTREELRQQLWPADTFVDFDHSLNAAIKRLREALGESADGPIMIETLPRRGYRFIGPAIAADGKTPPLQSVDRNKLKYFRRQAFLAASLLAILAGSGLYLSQGLWTNYLARPASLPVKAVPFTTDPGAEMDPSFSPDGRHAAYVKWDGRVNSGVDVFIKAIGGNQELQITHDSGWACCTAWSPDGLYVAYERCSGDHSGLLVVPALGGPQRRLADAFCGGISWSPDGTQIGFTRRDSSDQPWATFLLRVRDLALRPLTKPQTSDIADRDPTFSPDGKRLAFVRFSSPWVADPFTL